MPLLSRHVYLTKSQMARSKQNILFVINEARNILSIVIALVLRLRMKSFYVLRKLETAS